jgi:lysophospholipase L1-like esterase
MQRTIISIIASALLVVLALTWLAHRQQKRYENCIFQLNEWTHDWAGLDHYATANLRPQQSSSSSAPEVVFFGDSITEFWNLEQYFPGRQFVNRGEQRQTTAQMLIRFRQDVLELHPKVVVILAGTNDIAGNTGPANQKMISNNLQSMAELARANNISVVLGTLLPVHDHGQQPATLKRSPQKIAALNAWIQDYCRANACYLADYWSALSDSRGSMAPNLSDDGVHPNALGYRKMAATVSPLLKNILDKKLDQ